MYPSCWTILLNAIYQRWLIRNILTARLLACCCLFLFLWQLFCRRHLEARAEEEHRAQHHDPEKLLYPAIDPTNTVSASMIQPDAGRVYGSISLPPKPRKWRGSQLSLSDRSAGGHKFLFDPTFSSTTQPWWWLFFILMTHLLEILNIMRRKYFLVIPFLHYRCRAFIVIILKRSLEKLLYTKKV